MKVFFIGILFVVTGHAVVAQNIESYGIFAGLNIPFTVDQGLQKDPRFFPKITLRSTPIGFLYGFDNSDFGYAITPQYAQLGQHYTVRNVQGGEVGTRNIRLNYITVPIALKFHINDISFFRLSLVGSLAPSFLFSGGETFDITASELKYPKGVAVDPSYTVAYDGVYVPRLKNLTYVSKDKFNIFQLFAAVGLRSDFDLSSKWSINFDGRVNFGILDPRKSSYIDVLKNPSIATPDYQHAQDKNVPVQPGAPDLYGSRRDFFLSGQIGFCRIIQSKEKFNAKHSGKPVFHKSNTTKKKSKGKK